MKKILAIFLVAIIVVSVAACNGSSDDNISEASATEVATSVKEGVVFVDDMLDVNSDIVKDFYDLPEGVTDMKVYMSSSGATAEELAIFKCNDANTVESVVEACKKRIDDLKEKFEDYIPGEIEKIESAVIEKRGVFVMFVCANSTNPAKEKFENYKAN